MHQLQKSEYSILRNKYPHPKDDEVTKKFDIIKSVVCQYFNITEKEVCSGTRKHPVVFARQLIMAFIYANCPYYTLSFIGMHFGGRDHTTTIHSVNTVIYKLSSPIDDILKTGYNDILSLLPFESKPIKRRQPRFVYD